MKTTRKLIVALVLVMSILMTLAVAVIPASAANGDKIYLSIESVTGWTSDNAGIYAYFFGNGDTWVKMTKVENKNYIYECTIPGGGYTGLIFVRTSGSSGWGNKWNQTGDLTVEKAKNNCYYKLASWDNSDNTKWVGHNNTTSTTPATCLTAGSSTTTCSVCGNTSTTEIQATGHSFINEVEYKAAGCSSAGVQAHKQCENCNLYFAGDAAAYATDGVETANGFEIPSTGEHGYTHECDNVCVDCGLLTNPDASHNIEHVEAKAPTCTDNGNIEHWLCTYCGSCWTDAACTQVTNSKNVIISATGHSHEAVVTEPTCIKAGYTTYTCACGDTYTGNATSATGNHVYNELGKCTADADCSYVVTYFINANKWSAVSAHCWTDGGASTTWPGNAATKTDVQVNGFDVYSVGVDASKYNKIIFNNNNGGKQTINLDLVVGQYYHGLIGTWFESTENIPVVSSTKVFLAGSFCDWGTDRCNFVSENGGTVYTLILILPANTPYEFKVVNNGSWLGHSGTFTNDVTGKTFSTSTSANCKITTACAGEYVFKFDSSSKKLSVTYPHIGGEATCTAKAKCDVCGKEYGSSLGHNMITDAAVAPDCVNTGLTEGSHCSRCDHKVAQTVVPALGHSATCGHAAACVDGVYYATFEEALENASEGAIILNADVNLSTPLVLNTGVAIDLKGYTLTANGFVAFGGTITDSTNANGRLVVPTGKLEASSCQGTHPVLVSSDETTETFAFRSSLNYMAKDPVEVEGGVSVIFRPSLAGNDKNFNGTLFADGAADNKVIFTLVITRTPVAGGESESVELDISDAMFAQVYSNTKNAFQLTLTGANSNYSYSVELVVTTYGVEMYRGSVVTLAALPVQEPTASSDEEEN